MPRLPTIQPPVRSFRLLETDRRNLFLWLSRILELHGDWVFLVALLITVYRVTGQVAIVALVALARVVPHAVVVSCRGAYVQRIGNQRLVWLGLAKVPLVASLILVSSSRDLVWAGLAVLVLATLDALATPSRAIIVSRVVAGRCLGTASSLNTLIERTCFVVGPLLGAIVVAVWDPQAAFATAAIILTGAAVLVGIQEGRWGADHDLRNRSSSAGAGNSVAIRALRHLGQQSVVALLAGGFFAIAAVAITLKVALVALVTDSLGRSDALVGILIGLVGFGMLVGPLSVPRLLGRIPLPLIVVGSAGAVAAGMAVISRTESVAIVTVILFGVGVLSITYDVLAATAARRHIPEDQLDDIRWILSLAVVGGQIAGATALAATAWLWGVTTAILLVSVACIVMLVVLFLNYGGRETLATVRHLRQA